MGLPFPLLAGILGASGLAPPEFVQRWVQMTVTPTSGDPVTTHPAPLEAPLTPGNFALSIVREETFRQPFVVTDDGGNTYSSVYSVSHPTNTSLILTINGAVVTAPASVVTFTSTIPTGIRQHILEFSGFPNGVEVEDSDTTSGEDVTSASVTLTTTVPNCLLLAMVHHLPSVLTPVPDGDANLYRLDFQGNPPTPYTGQLSQHLLWKLAPTPGEYTLSSTWDGASDPRVWGIALRGA